MVKRKKGKAFFFWILSLAVFYVFSRFVLNIGMLFSALISILMVTFAITFIVLKRGYFWLDKSGNHLSFRQFLSRWRQGIEGITPLQQSKTNLMGMWITLTGLISGLIVMLLVRIPYIWMWTSTILVGSLIITSVQFIGMYQKYRKHKEVDKTMKELMKKVKK